MKMSREPFPVQGHPMERGSVDTETASQEDCHVKMEEEVRAMEQKPGDIKDWQQTTRSRAGAGTGSHSPRRAPHNPVPASRTSSLQNRETRALLKSFSLQYFVMTAKPIALTAQGGFYETGGRVGMR